MVEAHLAAHLGRVQGHRVGGVDDVLRHLEVLEDPVKEGEGALDLDLDVEHLAEREEDPALQRGEGDDGADADVRVAADDQRPSQDVDKRRHDAEERPNHREEPAAEHLLADLQVAKAERLALKAVDARALLAERLRQENPRDRQ